jgi:hypothetical protein
MLSWDYAILGLSPATVGARKGETFRRISGERFARFAALDTSSVLLEICPVLHGCKQSCLLVRKPPQALGTRWRYTRRWRSAGTRLKPTTRPDVGATLDFGSTVW